MPIVDEHNAANPPFVDLQGDKRPRCVLLIGNGFTMDLLHYFQLLGPQKIATWPLVPPPEWIQERQIRVSGTGLIKPLWSQERFPELFDAWHRHSSSSEPNKDQFLHVCEQLAKQKGFVVSDRPGAMTFTNRHPGVQLRYYLWHLFTQYEDYFLQRCKERAIEHWHWYEVLRFLGQHFRLTIVSYNYDCFLETLLTELGFTYFSPPVFCTEQLSSTDVGELTVLKPHGSISHTFPGVGGSEGAKLAVWADGDPGFQFGRDQLGLRECPGFPDLVPPGHTHHHYANLKSNVQHAIASAKGDCDLFVVCGFSASKHDADEFSAYLSNLRRTQVVSAIVAPSGGHVQGLLKGATSLVRHFTPNEVSFLPSWTQQVVRRSTTRSLRSLHVPPRVLVEVDSGEVDGEITDSPGSHSSTLVEERRRLVHEICNLKRSKRLFVAPDGDDKNSGESPKHPIKTIRCLRQQLEQSESSFQVSLKRGGVWRETYGLSDFGKPVTFDSYGQGPKPIISRFTLVYPPGTAWYRGSYGIHEDLFCLKEPNPVAWFRKENDLESPFLQISATLPHSWAGGVWAWEDSTLYMKLADSSDHSGVDFIYEAAITNCLPGLYLSANTSCANGLRFDGWSIGSKGYGMIAVTAPGVVVVVNDCESFFCGRGCAASLDPDSAARVLRGESVP